MKNAPENNTLKDTYRVKKCFLLNMIENELNIQELRLLSVFLSRVNPTDPSTRTVKINIADFQALFGLKHLWESEIKKTFRRLLSYSIFDTIDGYYVGVQLFKKIRMPKEGNEKYIEITAHDDAIPYLFDIRGHYFSYKLYNVIQLKSVNQFRMYELLKQYEKKGKRELEINALKQLIGIAPEKYRSITDFKKYVLDKCQIALKKYTDIAFEYKPCKTGIGGKWETILFTIKKNTPERGIEEKLKQDIINLDELATAPEPLPCSLDDLTAAARPTADTANRSTFLHDLLPQKEQGAPLEGEGAAQLPRGDLLQVDSSSHTQSDMEPQELTPGTEFDTALHNAELMLQAIEESRKGKQQGAPLEGVKELHNSLDDLTAAAAAPVPVGTPNRLQAPEPLPFSIAATPRGAHDLTESKPKRHETNEDIEILQDLYPEFTNADLQAFYVRLIKLEPNRHGTARVDYFIQLYKDIKARESHGNKIYNTPAYIIKCLDDRINNIM